VHAVVAGCNPLFDAMGQKTLEISERPRDANVTKLTGNFLIVSLPESLGEAFVLVRKSDIDAHRFLEVLTGSLVAAPVHRTYGS
jgi:3-hydroxyisobutyrate dehydrogenase-like beta-hydroxyacid dehydrogenase